jgi:hypothetical protein
MYRRSFLSGCAAAILAIATPAIAGADTTYPDRPIQIYVPFAAGSASDVITRILLSRMATSLGQNFVVENRPGAGGNTGTAAAAHAGPDGYTLVMSTSGPLAANKALFRELGYDPQKDLSPICLFATLPNIVVINALRTDRLCQATPQATQLRLGRDWLLAASRRRLFRTAHRDATRPHPLQEYRELCARLHLRAGAGRISTAAERSGPDQER